MHKIPHKKVHNLYPYQQTSIFALYILCLMSNINNKIILIKESEVLQMEKSIIRSC